MNLVEEKNLLRRRIWTAQKAVPADMRCKSDQRLFSVLIQSKLVQDAKSIFLFVGSPPEPETLLWIPHFLQEGKQISVPLCTQNGAMESREITDVSQLIKGKYGILEPVETCPQTIQSEIDLVLVPAICFSQSGFRLGRGGGYYDRWLKNYHGISIGICRTAFLQPQLPVETHDQKVDYILTEHGILAV